MIQSACQHCAEPYDVTPESNFCTACGHPQKLLPNELTAVHETLTAVHAAVLASVRTLSTDIEIAVAETGGTGWTRVDDDGYGIVSWCHTDAPGGGVHGVEIWPLRSGGFVLSGTASETLGARYRIRTLDDVSTVLPALLKNG